MWLKRNGCPLPELIALDIRNRVAPELCGGCIVGSEGMRVDAERDVG